MSNAVLQIADLHVSYGPIHAVTGLNLSLNAGTVCGLVGVNGSGKSTMFKAIMGLVPATGQVRICGLAPKIARRSGKVGYVPQSEEIDKAFPISVREVVMMGRYGYQGWTRRVRAEDRQAVTAALAQTGLTALADRPIGALSGGQRKRVFVARALAQGAQLMIFDEPFAGVDLNSQSRITELIRELAQTGRTVLVSTHDLGHLSQLCDEVALINKRIVFHGSVQEATRPQQLALAFSDKNLMPEGVHPPAPTTTATPATVRPGEPHHELV